LGFSTQLSCMKMNLASWVVCEF